MTGQFKADTFIEMFGEAILARRSLDAEYVTMQFLGMDDSDETVGLFVWVLDRSGVENHLMMPGTYFDPRWGSAALFERLNHVLFDEQPTAEEAQALRARVHDFYARVLAFQERCSQATPG